MDRIVCPYCGYDGSRPPRNRGQDEAFLYLEDIVNHRRVLGVRGSTLVVDGRYETGEGFDDGDNPRLLCGDCLGEFPVPDGLEPELV